MLNQLLQEIHKHKDEVRIVPISILRELKQEMYRLEHENDINGYQKYLIEKQFSYDIPEFGFEIRSAIITASPCNNRRIYFNDKGKRLPFILPATYSDYFHTHSRVFEYIKSFLSKNNYNVALAGELPCKLMAVISGLAQYGRNNLCYVEGMGSYINLTVLFSDIACEEEELSQNKLMDTCISCRLCRNNCPTGAILQDRILINNEKCLTFMNEAGPEREFPSWLPLSVHNAVVGCTVCQEVCPKNREHLEDAIDLTEFTEEETGLLLKNLKEEELPDSLREKLADIEMLGYLGALSRNLRVLLDQRG
jgi:epoxyqueuosine reductase